MYRGEPLETQVAIIPVDNGVKEWSTIALTLFPTYCVLMTAHNYDLSIFVSY